METFFIKEVERTSKKIKELKKEGCFCFNVVADSHVYPPNPEWLARQNHTFENLKAQNENAPIDAMFHLGDLFWTDGQPEATAFWSKENVDKWFHIFFSEFKKANERSYFVAGNHDNVGCSEPERAYFYKEMIEPNRESITKTVKNEPYYYVDFPENSVRAIVLMSNYLEDGHKNYGIYSEQVAWLRDEALLAPSGYTIFLFSHIFPQNIGIDSAKKDNVDEFSAFLRAFNNREKNDCEKFPSDFSNLKTDAKIEALFVGHGHVDWIARPSALPFWTIETGANHVHVPSRANWKMPEDCTVAERAYQTVTEDLFDTVVWNPKERTLDIIRFGAGEDRKIFLEG